MGVATRRTTGVLLLCLGMQVTSFVRTPQAATLTEAELQAAFLVNFTRFVIWPRQAFTTVSAPIVFGIVGEDPFGATIDAAVRGQRVNERPIQVRRAGSRDDLSRFHLVFIGVSEQKQLGAILDRLAGTPVLAVSDIERFCEAGGAIGFVAANGRVRFEINLPAAESRGLKISTRLLALATRVHTS